MQYCRPSRRQGAAGALQAQRADLGEQPGRRVEPAARGLFASSRARKASSNDADRLRKYLARFGLSYDTL